MMLPLLHLTGSPYEQGRQHGAALRDAIAENLRIYRVRFEREAQLPWPEALTRAAHYAEAIATLSPAYHAGMRGIAEGAGLPFDAIALLNVRYELLYYEFGQHAITIRQPDGCTAFALGPGRTANGHLLIGENWDWIPGVHGALLATTEDDGLRTLGFSEAGIAGAKIGLNSAGLGLLVNGMVTTADDWSRLALPFHARCYAILRAWDLDEAVAVVTGTTRACAANFVVAQAPDRAVDIEAAPDRARVWDAVDGALCHTNHFLDPTGLGVVEPAIERGPDSDERLARIGNLIAGERLLSTADLQAMLTDHAGYPDSICRHPDPTQPPEEQYATVVSVIMDLHQRELLIAAGLPCQHPYERYMLDAVTIEPGSLAHE